MRIGRDFQNACNHLNQNGNENNLNVLTHYMATPQCWDARLGLIATKEKCFPTNKQFIKWFQFFIDSMNNNNNNDDNNNNNNNNR